MLRLALRALCVLFFCSASQLARSQDLDAARLAHVDLEPSHAQAADLGEVLSRNAGMLWLRQGALGSDASLLLDGSFGDRTRLLVDGVPIELSEWSMGFANLPVSLFDRVDVYHGLTPVQLGVAANSGALDLISQRLRATGIRGSYQFGSLGTHRATLSGGYRDASSGLFVDASSFLDIAANDYDVTVEVPDNTGRVVEATVPRFHDGYLATGVRVNGGIVDRPWADRLMFSAFVSSFTKELQHNLQMTVPYGEAEHSATVWGLQARYDVTFQPDLSLEVVAAYAHRRFELSDHATSVYNWFGERVLRRAQPGEIEGTPGDNTSSYDDAFARAVLLWRFAPGHALRLATTPRYSTSPGADASTRAPATGVLTLVSGISHELTLFDGLLSNNVFVKDYVFHSSGRRQMESVSAGHHSLGVGDALLVRVSAWLSLAASYEYATRLPRAIEVLGDGRLLAPNLTLDAEHSHNVNLGPRVALRDTPAGDWTFESDAFFRDSEGQIVMVGSSTRSRYENVLHTRSFGLNNMLSWVSPDRFASLTGSLSWQNVRNVSRDGVFDAFEGERIPNQPYLYGSWSARVRIPSLPGANDTLEPYYIGRFVQSYSPSWATLGDPDSQLRVPSQVTHTLGVTWNLGIDTTHLALTLEALNVTDARVFDVLGVQRPGRTFYVKVTGEL